MPKPLPEYIDRGISARALDIDLAKRTIRNTVTTKCLARDGGIVLPEGIITRFYEQNPIVKIRHGMANDARPLVAGRSLGLTRTDIGMDSITQFADNQLGREWGYLYGLNEGGEVYLRAFSFGWASLQVEWITIERARAMLGNLWDEASVPDWCRRCDEVWVSARSEMHEYSVVEVGADREALSRAYNEHGINEAANIVARMDLGEARLIINQLRNENKSLTTRLDAFDTRVQALERDGSAAATSGNSAEVKNALRAMLAQLRE